MSTQQGADERRIRKLLIDHGVGPDAPPPAPTVDEPPARERDWLDDILDSDPAPTPTPEEPAPAEPEQQPEPKPHKAKSTRAKRRKEGSPTRPMKPQAHDPFAFTDPRQSLLDAWDRTPRRLKWLAYHATAAGPGWWLGWVDWSTDTAAWYAAGHWTAPSAWVLYGLGLSACALYRRSRHWAWPVAWAATVPVSSVVVGVLLYGTGYQP